MVAMEGARADFEAAAHREHRHSGRQRLELPRVQEQREAVVHRRARAEDERRHAGDHRPDVLLEAVAVRSRLVGAAQRLLL